MTSHTTGVPVGDRALWDRAAEGDETAFGELFERHAEAVWNHAYRLTGSWAAAEDLTSNTFLTAGRRRADVTLVRDSALPWLYTVAGNAARDEYRGAKRRRLLLRKTP
ncbi:RNA polymerase sigma factor, partial [Amycolatopsis sp. SID8362]|uniref:RNA polymerase sigma factor n=1 Tax=Amycolatopsis sp. SID8362 TaxID=2690346 RepID=UPI00136E283E